MKNREKYPNTDDAVKAYEAHKKEHNCDCTFEGWLDLDDDEIDEGKGKLAGLLAALSFGSIGFGLLAARKRKEEQDTKSKPGEGGDGKSDGEIRGVECPLCHSKNGRICGGMLYSDFHCPDCDALICKKGDVMAFSPRNDVIAFKAWFDKSCVAKKD